MNDFANQRTWGPTPKYPNVTAYKNSKPEFKVISGPCSVETPEQIQDLAKIVADCGGTHLRGGVFRAGTYPAKGFGLIDQELIQIFSAAGRSNGLKPVIEVLDYTEDALNRVAPYADVFQVGCRQMQNYTLLRTLGKYGKPVFLKRHPGATIDEWLGSAEHLLVGGVTDLTLIERGSVSHATHVRWDLSLSIIPAIQALTNIPVVCDASHGTGRRDLVTPMTLAGVAAGADGVLVEVHQNPQQSISDSEQAIDVRQFRSLMARMFRLKDVMSEDYAL